MSLDRVLSEADGHTSNNDPSADQNQNEVITPEILYQEIAKRLKEELGRGVGSETVGTSPKSLDIRVDRLSPVTIIFLNHPEPTEDEFLTTPAIIDQERFAEGNIIFLISDEMRESVDDHDSLNVQISSIITSIAEQPDEQEQRTIILNLGNVMNSDQIVDDVILLFKNQLMNNVAG